MIPRKVSAADAKNRFGELLIAAQREPVTIEKHGKAVAVMVSQEDFDDLQRAKLSQLQAELDKGLADIEAGRTVDGPEAFRALREQLK